LCHARKVSGHVYVCYGYRYATVSTIFHLIFELFRQFGIFFILILFLEHKQVIQDCCTNLFDRLLNR